MFPAPPSPKTIYGHTVNPRMLLLRLYIIGTIEKVGITP